MNMELGLKLYPPHAVQYADAFDELKTARNLFDMTHNNEVDEVINKDRLTRQNRRKMKIKKRLALKKSLASHWSSPSIDIVDETHFHSRKVGMGFQKKETKKRFRARYNNAERIPQDSKNYKMVITTGRKRLALDIE